MEDKYILTPEEVNELMKDWFVRDGETFTKIPDVARLGWETETVDGTYSSFFLKGITDFEYIIRRCHEMGMSMVYAMELPIKVNLILRKELTSFTDGKDIFITTSMFDDNDITAPHQIDVFLGVIVHEGCHIKFTDFKPYQEEKRKIIRTIANVLEDERIEQLIGYEKPGFVRFLEQLKYYYFDKYFFDESSTPEDAFTKVFNTFLRIIRYPRYLDRDTIELLGERLYRIRDILTPYPDSTESIMKASELIWLILKEFCEEEMRKELEKEESEMTDEEKESFEKSLSERLDKTASDVSDKFSKVFGEMTDEEKGDTSAKMPRHVAEELAGVYTREGKGFLVREKNDKNAYEDSLSRIRRYIGAFRKVISYQDVDYKIVHKSMRSGTLDPTKIVEARQNVPTVYERVGQVKSDKVAVCLLIDLSGSMSGSKIRAAQDTAVLLNEVLKTNHAVELFIYGHTADILETYKNQLHVYREPGHDFKFSLGKVKAMSQNRDGDAIRESVDRVRKFTQRKCLMFVIADGEPAASYYGGSSAMEDVKKAVKYAESHKFDVLQITIDSSLDPRKMFKHFIILTDLGKLAFDLGRAIKKQIVNNTRTRVL